MKFEIKNRWTKKVQFEHELEASFEIKNYSIQLGAVIKAAYKSGADLCGADLCGADLCGADLRGANLCGANLRGADLCDANLCDAILCGADLCDANLRGADLCDADLCGAILCDADLCDADLRDANLRDANLCGVDLRGAILCGADLRGAEGLKLFPISVFGHKHSLQTTQEGLLQIGCQVHSFEDWEKFAEALGQENGYSDLDVEIYKLHIQHIAKVSKLLWNKNNSAEAVDAA